MSAVNEESRIRLIIDGDLANATLKEMENAAKDARKALWSMSADDPKRKQLIADYQELKENISETKKEINGSTQAASELANSAGGATGQFLNMFKEIKSGVQNGVKAFSTLRGAIAATGIGLLIIAITTLVGWFKKTDEGAMVLEGIMRAVGAVIDVVFNGLINMAKGLITFFSEPKKALIAIVDFIGNNLMNRLKAFLVIWDAIKTGNMQKALDGVIQLGTGIENATEKAKNLAAQGKKIADEMIAAAKEAYALAEVFDELDDKRRAMELAAASSEMMITRYLLQSKNVALSLEERMGLLDKASALENADLQEKIAYQDQMIAAIERENALKERQGTLMDEDLDKINQARIQRIQLETESMNLQEKIVNRRSQLQEKIAAEEEKAEKERQEMFQKKMDDLKREVEMRETLKKFKEDELKKEIDEVDAAANKRIMATQLLKIREKKTEEWLAEQEKQIKLQAAQEKLDIVRRFGEDEIEFELEMALLKEGLSKQEAERVKEQHRQQSEAWFNYYYSQLEIAADHAKSEEEYLNIRIEQIMAAAERERAIAGDNAHELLRIELETADAIEKVRAESAHRKGEAFKNAGQEALSFAGRMNTVIGAFENASLKQQQNRAEKEKKELKNKLDSKKISQETYNSEIERLDEDLTRARISRERDAAVRQKIISVAQIAFETSTAIMKAIAASPLTVGMPWSAIIAGMGAFQTAAVLSAPLPEMYSGGYLPRSSSDRTPVPMIGHANEYMVDANSLRDPFVVNTVNVVEAAKAQGTTPSRLMERGTSGSSSVSGSGSGGELRALVDFLKEESTKPKKFEIDDEAGFKLNRILKKQVEFDESGAF